MILKHKDDVAPLLAELELLLKTPGLKKEQREEIENEIWMIRAGAKGEKDAAYHIDFSWKDAKNHLVLHDLRIEHDGRVAQIDHLILMRTMDCHVLESKGFSQEVRITEVGEWETKTRYGWKGMPSPIEQNERHISVVKSFVEDRGLLPKRLGLTLPLKSHNWVLVSPQCQLSRKGEEWKQVVKMDMFKRHFDRWIDGSSVVDTLSSFSKLVSVETLQQLAQGLLAAHTPATFNFAAKFGISGAEANDDSRFAPPDPAAVKCESCAAILEPKVVNFCRLNSKRFGGKKLCQKCQKIPAKAGCDVCGVELEDKVIAFCRFNSKRFGGKNLCRSCQGASILS
jgi:hypothetical protein